MDAVAAGLLEDGATVVEEDVDVDAALFLDAEYLNSISWPDSILATSYKSFWYLRV
jgi:hypothetical protein